MHRQSAKNGRILYLCRCLVCNFRCLITWNAISNAEKRQSTVPCKKCTALKKRKERHKSSWTAERFAYERIKLKYHIRFSIKQFMLIIGEKPSRQHRLYPTKRKPKRPHDFAWCEGMSELHYLNRYGIDRERFRFGASRKSMQEIQHLCHLSSPRIRWIVWRYGDIDFSTLDEHGYPR